MPRWKFPLSADDAARRPILAAIDCWWAAFASRTADLDELFHQRQQWDLPAWMAQHLGAVHPSLMWEYGAGLEGGHRLVITPESRRDLVPLTETILARAPRLDGWSFHPYRLAESLEETLQTVKGRTGGDLTGATVIVQVGENGRIDLYYQLPRFAADANVAEAFVASESLLGEEMLHQWIGLIEVGPPRGHAIPLDQLRERVIALTGRLLDQLPDRPCWQRESAGYNVFEFEREPLADCSGWEDLYVATTGFPEPWQATHADPNFDSLRYSRHGERFAYLKIDASDGLDPEQRGILEDDIDEALKPAGLGCVIGGGTGSRYAYIDLALADVARAASVLREVLQASNVPKRSWLLFFDREWEAEYIGVWDDSPAPLMADFEE